MPTYDYRCLLTDERVTVRHSMNTRITSWGELCALAGRDPGAVDPQAAVEKVLSFGGVVRSQSLKNPSAPPCMSGGGCPSGGCRG